MTTIKVDALSNPHLGRYKNKSVPYHIEFTATDRILKSDDKVAAYDPRRTVRSTFHWGQRKLLISEIEFLLEYGDLASNVVYVGAGSRASPTGISLGGIHISKLSQLFPKHIFHLYDPTDFGILESEKIKLYNQYFTNKDAKEWQDKNILYISDIRTVGDTTTDKVEYATGILSDMNNQLNWSRIMKPAASMVKFKLPYGEVGFDNTVYPVGRNFLPVWGRPTTTETRLMFTDPENTIEYDNYKHEEQMAYFNNNTLLSYYEHDHQIEGFDHCFSCRSELHILEKYVRKIYGAALADHFQFMKRQVKRISEEITKSLTKRTFQEQYLHSKKYD